MKTNSFKKLLSVATSLSLALAFTFMQSNVASADVSTPASIKSLAPGQEGSFSSTVCYPDNGFSFYIKEGSQGTYKVKALENAKVLPANQVINKLAKFAIVMDDNGVISNAESVDGVASIILDKPNYDSVFLKVKNGADSVVSDFSVFLEPVFSPTPNTPAVSCTSGASRILAPIAALLGGLLLLF